MALRWPPKATSSVFTLPLALAQPGYHTVLPVCLNLLPELKALGWVPPSASADAAFLHMRCRLPRDARLAYALHSALRQSNCLRLHRHATSGVSAIPEAAPTTAAPASAAPASAAPPDERAPKESPEAEAAEAAAAAEAAEEVEEVEADIVPVEVRSLRRVLTLSLTLRSLPSQPDAAAVAAAAGAAVGAAAAAATAAAGRQASPEAVQAAKAAREAAIAAAAAAVETMEVVADERGVPLSGSLLRCVQEAAAWLYPGCGSTPALVTLRATDPAAAAARNVAVRAGALPLQAEAGLRYAVEAHWGARVALRCAALLGATREAQAAEAEEQAEGVEEGAGGAWLFGFGPQLECGLHLAAKANRPEALAALWRDAIGSGMSPLELRGRGAINHASRPRRGVQSQRGGYIC